MGGNCAAILQGVGVQAIVTEILVQFADLLFSDNRVDGDDTEKGSNESYTHLELDATILNIFPTVLLYDHSLTSLLLFLG